MTKCIGDPTKQDLVRLNTWDTAGNERFRSASKLYWYCQCFFCITDYHNAALGLLLRRTFEELQFLEYVMIAATLLLSIS